MISNDNRRIDCSRYCIVNGVLLIARCFKLPAVEKHQFQYKVFLGLVWLTNNQIFGSSDFWDKTTSWFLKILNLPLFYYGNFKMFENALEQFIPHLPPKHVITCTNWLLMIMIVDFYPQLENQNNKICPFL